MSKKLKYEDVKLYIENNGYLLISDNYINNSSKLHLKCPHYHDVYMAFGNFKTGKRCAICKGVKKRTHEEFIKIVNNLTNGEYEVIGQYKATNNKLKFKHLKCSTLFEMKPVKFLEGQRCPFCAGKMWNSEIYSGYITKITNGEYKVISDYQNCHTKVEFYHDVCDSYFLMNPSSFLSGARCPICCKNKLKTTDEFKEEIYSLVNDEYTLLSEYMGANRKIEMKHNTCNHIFYTTPTIFLSGSGCSICAESKGEKKIRKFLEKSRIKFIPQYKFEDLVGVNGGLLKFDFAVFDIKNKLILLIEYDGIFHYKKQYDDDGHNILLEHDSRKNKYCEDNNIYLLRIPYWDFNKVEEILHNELI